MRVTTGHREIYGKEAQVPQIVEILQQYSLEEVIAVLSRASLYLWGEQGGIDNAAAQRFLAQSLLATDVQLRLQERLNTEKPKQIPLLFHERQLLSLLKIACLYLDPGAPPGEKDASGIGQALLMTTDLIDQQAHLGGPDPWTEAASAYFFANYHFYSHRNYVHEYGRTHAMLYGPEVPEVIKAHLSRCSSHDPELLLAALIAVMSSFGAWSKRVASEGTPSMDPEQFQRGLDPSLGDAGRLLALVGQPLENLVAGVRSRYSAENLRHFDFLPFERLPLVSFQGRWWCVSAPLLMESAGLGLRHRLIDPHLFNERERRHLLNAFGDCFQQYADRLLNAAFPATGVGGKSWESAVKSVSKAASTMSHADYIIPYGDMCCVVEYKSASASLAARSGENWKALQDQVKAIIVHSALQLSATETLLDNGCLVEVPSGTTKIPICITLDFSPDPLLYESIRRLLKETSGVSANVANRLQFFDVRDLEQVEVAIRRYPGGFRRAMEDKLKSPSSVGLSLTNYLASTALDKGSGHNAVLEREYEFAISIAEAALSKVRTS